MSKAQPKNGKDSKRSDVIALLLPAMTLNETEFPELSVPTLAARYEELVDPPLDDAFARALGMNAYVNGLQDWLDAEPSWHAARNRIVVAHSFGAMLALDWLSHRPRPRVDGLVLISASAGPLFGRVRLKVFGLPLRLPLAWLMPLWNTRMVTRTCKRILGSSKGPLPTHLRSLARVTDFAVDRAGWHDTDWRRIRALRLALDGFDVRDRLSLIEASTLVLHGDQDPLFDVNEVENVLCGIRHAELRVVRGAGHALPVSHPEAVQAAVNDLCRRLEHPFDHRATRERNQPPRVVPFFGTPPRSQA